MRRIAARLGLASERGIRVPISTKLILSFLLIITIVSGVFIVVGIRIIGDRVVQQAQENVRQDLNAAREIYLGELRHTNDVVQFTADRFFIKDALMSGDLEKVTGELEKVKKDKGLDILSIADETGEVLLRINNVRNFGQDVSKDELIEAVLDNHKPHASTYIIPAEELKAESYGLTEQANFNLIDTPWSREREEMVVTDGMMLKAAAPIFNYEEELIGVLYGGVLLNRNYDIVDKIKGTVYENLTYGGKDIGTATIFQDDVRISTNVRNENGTRAIGTLVSEEVYDRVVSEGLPWIERAYVVNDWYITAYEPIRNVSDEVIGILYVGVLEQKYVDIQRQTILAFLAITLLGALGSMLLSYFLSQRISVPIQQLANASGEIAEGNLDINVEIQSNDELGDLAESFNAMTFALKERDEQLKEFATRKVMESERLALIGQLSANVAHELNNPLQGIVTYAHLLLEKQPENEPCTESVQRIVTQANRCRDIIRGLLDFSRQRMPDKTVCSINSVLQECVTFIEGQAPFQNIEIETQFDESIPMSVVDPSQMQQVFLNMIINSSEAIEQSGKINLNTSVDPTGRFIEIEITDNGSGIAQDDLEHIFDPFFTTKEVGHGTGLGLAISYGIVKKHNGSILVESEVGQGTTFHIRIPVTALDEDAEEGIQEGLNAGR